MSIAANIGDVAILDFEACFPDSMIGMIPDHKTNLDFLYYLMRAMPEHYVAFCRSEHQTQPKLRPDWDSFRSFSTTKRAI